MQVSVIVGVAVARPPTVANTVESIFVVDAPTELAATLLAAQWAASKPGVAMPVSTRVVDVVP